jgi:SHS2 domain-containing protein
MTRSFESIEHTADVGIVARGDTVEDVFAAAADGMLSFIIDRNDVRTAETRRRIVEADDREGLLVAWLNDLILLLNADGFVPADVRVLECTDTRLVAEVQGEPVDPARHRFRLDVKAATYHQLEVSRPNGWRARVILDV